MKYLVTCPVCKVDQHIYANRVCVHNNGDFQCAGSKMPLNANLAAKFLNANLAAKARLDADKTAKPLTKLVGHAKIGDCVGPGVTVADQWRHEDGTSIPLAVAPEEDPGFTGVGRTAHFKGCPRLEGKPCTCDNGQKSLQDCAELIDKLKKDILSPESNCIPTGCFSEQAFLLAIAALDAAAAHMRTAEYWEARND